MREYLKIVVTGDVDSGKSTLIGRVLHDTGSLFEGAFEDIKKISKALETNFEFAYLLDSFEEERKNQLTIDTTQAFCKTRDGKRFIFIDVPGHKELIKNMLTGSSYADTAVLVIDAQKSVEDQTKRHLFILKFLGISKIILAVNKMDLIGFSQSGFEAVKEKIGIFTEKIGVKPEYFIPLSAKEGENITRKSKKMPWYRGLPFIKEIGKYSAKRINEDFRFALQDVYELQGAGVAVGGIISGKLNTGKKVDILPFGKSAIVKAIKTFGKNKRYAEAPESIGLILDDMKGLNRGQLICSGHLPQVKDEFYAKIFCIHSMNVNQNLRFKCFAQDVPARVKKITGVWDTSTLEPKTDTSLEETNVAEIILVTDAAVTVETDKTRFVLQGDRGADAIGIIL
ncbi:MAG: GTP-binding protein [Candidatus Omnitrophica bacterium]|nr:GTP-binding protein [Candidatus Omnitrophota bacterium]MDD5553352.1 GTP-binding protein [Candidatus Omnitrophota bacterium]